MSSSPFRPFADARPPRSSSSGCLGDPASAPQAEGTDFTQQTRHVLEDLYKTQRGKLQRFLQYRVGNEDATDMVQDAFLRMAKTGKVHQIEEPRAYLWCVVYNLMFEWGRKRKRENLVFQELDEERHAVCPPEQEFALEEARLQQIYKRGVDSLPDKTRYVFMMCRIDGMSHAQVAQELGISVKTVEFHMGKALTHLARVMDAIR